MNTTQRWDKEDGVRATGPLMTGGAAGDPSLVSGRFDRLKRRSDGTPRPPSSHHLVVQNRDSRVADASSRCEARQPRRRPTAEDFHNALADGGASCAIRLLICPRHEGTPDRMATMPRCSER